MSGITSVIVACEVGFWVFLLCGLIAKYVLNRHTLGWYLLAMSLAVTWILLIATLGAPSTKAHTIAPIHLYVYINIVTVSYFWSPRTQTKKAP